MARVPHKPTPETLAQVEALSGYGVRHDEIALYLDIDPKTLRKHYREQLDKGTIKANAGIARSLHKQATEGNVAAAIFWLKARAGWSERQKVEISGPDGGPIQTATQPIPPMSREEWIRTYVDSPAGPAVSGS